MTQTSVRHSWVPLEEKYNSEIFPTRSIKVTNILKFLKNLNNLSKNLRTTTIQVTNIHKFLKSLNNLFKNLRTAAILVNII